MAYRFKTRNTDTGAYRFKSGTLAQFTAPLSILVGAYRGDGVQGEFNEGLRNTDPGIANVRKDVGYWIAGTEYSGEMPSSQSRRRAGSAI